MIIRLRPPHQRPFFLNISYISVNFGNDSLKQFNAMKRIIPVIILLSDLFLQPVSGQVDTIQSPYMASDTQNVNVRLFEKDDLIEIALRFDITTFRKQKSNEEYLPAILTYYTDSNDSINKDIKIRARGNMRRTYCDFPPISLNFKLKDSVETEFDGIDKLKLVTYCKLGYEDYVLKEYLAYKLYNVLTENSLRVRLLRIKYINTVKEKKPTIQYGFVIEPVELLEKRTNSIEVKSTTLTQKYIKPEMMDRFAIFNYMIGNVDWSVPNLHNSLILAQPGSLLSGLAMIVAYDFDYSGLVNTTYAVPFETLPIESVRERYYMGICRSEAVFTEAVKEFAEKKDEFYRVINEFPYLKERVKKEMITYLAGFFNQFDKRNTIVYKIMSTCKDF